MSRIRQATAIVGLVIASLVLAPDTPHGQSRSLVIRGVAIITGTEAAAPLVGSVVVTGERITYVGENRGATVPPGALVIDGSGKYLIPGLIDMHAHVSKVRGSALGLYVANGVTTVRDAGGDHEELLRWRAEIQAGTRVGPRLLIAGPYLESANNVARMTRQSASEMAEPVERTRIPVGSPADAARIVAGLAGRVDHIKIRTVQNRETYLALGEAARKHNLPLIGHVYGLAAEDILLSGQRSIEHQFYPTLDPMTPDARAALFTRYAAAGVGVVPTLVTATRSILPSQRELQAIVDDEEGKLEPRRRYLSRYSVIDWREQVPEQTDGRRNEFRKIYTSQLRDLREMRQAGVRIMTGSDAAVLNVFPGSSISEELDLFVRDLGMPPTEALASATRVPAEFMALGKEIGTIETGKIADLVLLDANPLDDVTNVQRIASVILRGRLFDRGALDRVLADVAAAPDRRMNDWPRTPVQP